MPDLNRISVIGRLAQDVYFPEGGPVKVARFVVVVHRRLHDGAERADFIPCVAFSKDAMLLQQAKKGDKIYVSGLLEKDPGEEWCVRTRELILFGADDNGGGNGH